MAILYFQILIIFTLYLARRLGKKSLVIVCCAWSIFSLSNGFLPGVILLQLFTLWAGCYWFLKRKTNHAAEAPATTPAKKRPAVSGPTPAPPLLLVPVASTPLESPPTDGGFLRSLDTLNNALSSFNDSVCLSLEVQKATASLAAVLFTEKLCTEKALERARAALKLAAWRQEHGEKAWAHYLQAQAIYTKALDSSANAAVAAPLPEWRHIDFSSAREGDTPLAIAIEAKKRQLQGERDRFFSDIAQQVWADLPLRIAMADELSKVGGHETWACISRQAEFTHKPLARLTFGAVLGKVQTSTADRPTPVLQGRESIGFLPGFLLKQALQTRARVLELPYLVHFTRVENLPSIMQHGLCSITTLNDKQIDFRFNDHLRLEGQPHAICLSIGHPNDKMFASYRWKSPEQGWAVLVIDRCALWSLNTAFCNHNAADHRIRQRPLGDLKTLAAFDSLFMPLSTLPSREDSRLLPYDPTDVQAEVLIFDTLLPELINGVVFSDPHNLQTYKDCIAGKPAHLHTESHGFLGARTYARKTGWTY